MKMKPKSEALRADKEAEGKEKWQKSGEGCKKHGKKGCKECYKENHNKAEYKEDHEVMNK